MKFSLGSTQPDGLIQVHPDLWVDQDFVQIGDQTWQAGYVLDQDMRSGSWIHLCHQNGNWLVQSSFFKDRPLCVDQGVNNIGLGQRLSLDITDLEWTATSMSTRAPVAHKLLQSYLKSPRKGLEQVADQIHQILRANLSHPDVPLHCAFTFGLDSSLSAAITVDLCRGPRLVIDQEFRDLATRLPWPYYDLLSGERRAIDETEVADFFEISRLLVGHWGDHVFMRRPKDDLDCLDKMSIVKWIKTLLWERIYHVQDHSWRFDPYRDPRITAAILQLDPEDLKTQIEDEWIQKHLLRQYYPKWWTCTFRTKNLRSSLVPEPPQPPGSISHVMDWDFFRSALENFADRR